MKVEKRKNLLFLGISIVLGLFLSSAPAQDCPGFDTQSLTLSRLAYWPFIKVEDLEKQSKIMAWYGKCHELDTHLTSYMAYHLNATKTYTFYEVVDQMFGPWGENGYPIGYGKHYNILFTQNKRLMSNTYSKEWVEKTTVALQRYVKNYLVARCMLGNLHYMKESELRSAAFDSHPAAYTQSGLDEVLIMAPELMWTIAKIPAKEFKPTSENFGATVKQVLITAGITTTQVGTATVVYSTLPAHHGGISRAYSKDYERYRRMLWNPVMRGLENIEGMVKRGDLDSVGVLNALMVQLSTMQYENETQRLKALEIARLAIERAQIVAQSHSQDIRSGDVKSDYYDTVDPSWRAFGL